MQVFKIILLIALLLFGTIVLIKVFSAPLKLAMKLALNTFFGYIVLLGYRLVGALFGFSLGINFINALVVGLFGIPGFFLLVLIRWLFRN